VVHLYNTWDADVRYWYRDIDDSMQSKLTKQNIFKLLGYADEAFKHVSRL
jgi:hypothetical protein